ncbi:MAG: hypothetical protein ACTSRG_21280 [Candidatus Helarchaeota archaeon]
MEKVNELSDKENLRNAQLTDSIIRTSMAKYFLDHYDEKALIDYYRNTELANQIAINIGKKDAILINLAKKFGDKASSKILELVISRLIESIQWYVNYNCMKDLKILDRKAFLKVENCSNRRSYKKALKKLKIDLDVSKMCQYFCIPVYEEICKTVGVTAKVTLVDKGCNIVFEI